MSEQWSPSGPVEPLESVDESPTAPEHLDEPAMSGTADEGSVFVAELVRAWQTTASLERNKIDEDTERRRQAHIDKVRALEASEAERIRELAREDMNAIESWADGEKERIKLERQRRMTELHDDLDLSLAEHHSRVELEIEGVEAAIATYRAEVEAFFERLDRETDLVAIAQQAAMRPVFPTLGDVPATFAAVAADSAEPEPEPSSAEAPPAGADDDGTDQIAGMTERSAVGVMEPQPAAEPVTSWADPLEPDLQPVPVGASDDVDAGAEREPAEPVTAAAEPVTAAIAPSDGDSATLLQSVVVKQPMGWLRRHTSGSDHANGEG
jgi:hypothetical protein